MSSTRHDTTTSTSKLFVPCRPVMRRDAFSSVVARRCSGHIGALANCTALSREVP
ncbi:hypothetical protein J6590_080805 [Homalodisca vitripennis]|nr:hypothetical protein J6590_080805 [Homalodisca vitripennis]